jgi:hypothetical protein
MKKGNIAIAMIAVIAAASCATAKAGSMENLAGAGDKIASVDMKKDFSQAGDILDGFFSGSAPKKGAAPVEASVSGTEAAAGNAVNAYGQTAKELCNAQAAKPGKLAAEVKPLAAASIPNQKGPSFWDDTVTVVNYLIDVVPDAAQVVVDVVQVDPIGLIDSVPDLYNSATCQN